LPSFSIRIRSCRKGNSDIVVKLKARDLPPNPDDAYPAKRGLYSFFARAPLPVNRPVLLHFNSTPLFSLDTCSEKYAHLLKKKDIENIGPIVNYFINNSGNVLYLGGEVVRNLYMHGKRKYRVINILAILTSDDLYRYSGVLNNIISSNDGAFSMGLKYQIRKNRGEGFFRDTAQARYIIEPRLEGPEKLFSLFKPATIELDFTIHSNLFQSE
jgi:hypothetical protein